MAESKLTYILTYIGKVISSIWNVILTLLALLALIGIGWVAGYEFCEKDKQILKSYLRSHEYSIMFDDPRSIIQNRYAVLLDNPSGALTDNTYALLSNTDGVQMNNIYAVVVDNSAQVPLNNIYRLTIDGKIIDSAKKALATGFVQGLIIGEKNAKAELIDTIERMKYEVR